MGSSGVKPSLNKLANPNYSFWVNASAGTGKTTILVKRVLGLLLNNVGPEKILCITFTKAAAVEMEERVKNELSQWVFLSTNDLKKKLQDLLGVEVDENSLSVARRLFAKILEAENSFKIQTIHSFCQSIIQKFSFEVGVVPNFKVFSERDISELVSEVKSKIYGLIDNEKDLKLALEKITLYSSEFSLNEILKEIISNKEKFRDLVSNINNNELRENLQNKFKVDLNDLDTVNVSFIKNCPDLFQFREDLDIGGVGDKKISNFLSNWVLQSIEQKLDNIDEYYSIFLTKQGVQRQKIITDKIAKEHLYIKEAFIREQERVYNHCEQIRTIKLIDLSVAIISFARVFIEELDKKKIDRCSVDYDDLITLTKNLLSDNFYRDWVLYKMDSRIDHILVDEAQDTSKEQWQIIDELTSEFFSGDGAVETARSLFVVGDEKQSIYSFQGADYKFFNSVNKYFKDKIQKSGRDFEQIELIDSYRSSETIINLVDEVFNSNDLTDKIALSVDSIHHGCIRKGDFGSVELWPVLLQEEDSEKKLAFQIGERIKSMLDSNYTVNGKLLSPRDIMILVRKRDALFINIINALKLLNIPVSGVDRLNLMDNIGVEDLLAAANFALLPSDDYNLACLLKSPLIDITEDELFTLCHNRKLSLWENIKKQSDEDQSVSKVYNSLLSIQKIVNKSPYEFFSHILYNLMGYKKLLTRLGEEVKDCIDELFNLIIEFENEHSPNLQIFIKWISNNNSEIKRNLSKAENKVQILTVHGAKGLQAPVLIMPDTTKIPTKKTSNLMHIESNLAIWKGSARYQNDFLQKLKDQENAEQYNEYLRLLYVALTRSEDILIVAGIEKSKEINSKCWYSLIKKAILRLNYTDIDGVIECKSGKNEISSTNIDVSPNILDKIPQYLFENAADHDNYIKHISPSQLEKSESIYRSPYDSVYTGNSTLKGITIHKVLELISKVKINKREMFIDNYLTKQQIHSSLKDEIKIHCLGVIKKYPSLFEDNLYDELKVGGELLINGKPYIVQGQIDKVVISKDEVSIIDFKSSSILPKDINEVEKKYISQMYLYGRMLKKIFGLNARSSLVWTKNFTKMDIPDQVIQKYESEIKVD